MSSGNSPSRLGPKKVSDELGRLMEKVELYEMILDNIYNGVLITDEKGIVTFFSKTYGQFLGMDPKDQIGKHTTEVIENTRMHVVARTGEPEINWTQRIKGQDMVVQRIPIKRNGKVVAVFGQVMFKTVQDLRNLVERLNLLKSKVDLYERELESLRSSKYTLNQVIGTNPRILELKDLAMKAAQTHYPVLVTGESGTGKELFAHAIHHASSRRLAPFIRLSCAAIPKDLLEAELFGYEPGAFTGAVPKGKPGKFELAHQGSIFLDEISELPLEMQPKLLRVLEEKEFERVGGTKVIRSDFRLIAASNKELGTLVEEGKFREDLYYRLNVIPLHLPPLRDRKEDIPQIARHLLSKSNEEMGTNVTEICPKVMEIFEAYPWPGNIREMGNLLERMIYSIDGTKIELDHLPIFIRDLRTSQLTQSKRLREIVGQTEKKALVDAIRMANGNKNRAAHLLGIHRTILYRKMKKYGIDRGQTYQEVVA